LNSERKPLYESSVVYASAIRCTSNNPGTKLMGKKSCLGKGQTRQFGKTPLPLFIAVLMNYGRGRVQTAL